MIGWPAKLKPSHTADVQMEILTRIPVNTVCFYIIALNIC